MLCDGTVLPDKDPAFVIVTSPTEVHTVVLALSIMTSQLKATTVEVRTPL